MKRKFIKRMVGIKFRCCLLYFIFVSLSAFSQKVDTSFVTFLLKSKIISSINSADIDELEFKSNINRKIYFDMEELDGKYSGLYFITVRCGEKRYSDSSINEHLLLSGKYYFLYNPIAGRVYHIALARWREILYLLKDIGIYSKKQINKNDMIGIFNVLDLWDVVNISKNAEFELKRKHNKLFSTFEHYRIEVK